MVTDDDLEFLPIRSGTDQWNINHDGKVVARVTHRIVAKPEYSLIIINDEEEEEGEEVFHDDRDGVVESVLARLNEIPAS